MRERPFFCFQCPGKIRNWKIERWLSFKSGEIFNTDGYETVDTARIKAEYDIEIVEIKVTTKRSLRNALHDDLALSYNEIDVFNSKYGNIIEPNDAKFSARIRTELYNAVRMIDNYRLDADKKKRSAKPKSKLSFFGRNKSKDRKVSEKNQTLITAHGSSNDQFKASSPYYDLPQWQFGSRILQSGQCCNKNI